MDPNHVSEGMESLNKTSTGRSCQVPIRPRREDSRFPPLQTGPGVPVLVQELSSGELSRYEGGQVLGTPGSGSLRPMGLSVPSAVHCFICTFADQQDGYFHPVF